MSKKHFEEFAAALALISDFEERSRVAELIADVCRRCNPRFDRSRFVYAIETLARGDRPPGFALARFNSFMIERRGAMEATR